MPIIDVHAHFGEWFFPIRACKLEDILKMCQKFGLEKVIFSSTLGIVYDMIEGNRELKQLVDIQPQFYGYAVLNPNYLEASKREMEKYLIHPKFVGIKLHPGYSGQAINSPASKELIRAALRYNKPLLAHTWGESDANAVIEVAKESMPLKIIMAHMGGDGLDGGGWKAGIRVASLTTNTYLEVCGSALDRDRIKEAVEKVGSHRILFGSDLTLLNPAFIIGMIEEADISDKAKENIFYNNAKRLFEF